MPVDRSAIDAQLREIGEGDRWWEQREFRDLPYILNADERIRGVVIGKLLGPRRPRVFPTARWLVVATDQRLICLREQRFGRQQMDMPLGQIRGMRHSSGVRGVQITIETPQRKYRIRVPKADAFRFVGALAPLLPQASAAVDVALGLHRAVCDAAGNLGAPRPGHRPLRGRLREPRRTGARGRRRAPHGGRDRAPPAACGVPGEPAGKAARGRILPAGRALARVARPAAWTTEAGGIG